jgi:tetratricopeptide (TPR) repeat protein
MRLLQSSAIGRRIAAVESRRACKCPCGRPWPVLLGVILATIAGLAQGSAQAASLWSRERAARKACLDGDYAKGVSLLSDLFLDTHDSTFIFNQGRCLEQNRRYEEAIAKFEEYLHAAESSKLSRSDRAAARKHIADCKESLAQQPVRTETPPPPVVVSPPAAPAPQPQAKVPPPVVALKPATSPAQPAGAGHTGLRTAGIATAAVGGAALIAGVILNLKVNSMANDMEKPASYSDSKESDRKTYETLGWVSYGVGAACVATGAILYLLGLRDSGTRPGSVALLPSLSSGHLGAVLQGGF